MNLKFQRTYPLLARSIFLIIKYTLKSTSDSPFCYFCLLCVLSWPHGLAHQTPLTLEFSSQKIQECVPIPFSRRSSQPRDRTLVSCTAGRFFTIWTTREALMPSIQFNSILTLLTMRWHQIAQVKGSLQQDFPPLQRSVRSPDCQSCFWPWGYGLEVLMSACLSSICQRGL